MSTRVLIVDDHAIVRRGLRSILELEPDIDVVAEVGEPGEALRALERTRPDVVLLDLKLSVGTDADGLEVCSKILERRPATGVVVFSTFLDERLVAEALRRGAQAYVLKDVDVSELVRIIRAVALGKSGFDSRSAAVVRALARGPAVAADDQTPPLTKREHEVMCLIAKGLTNREIGRAIYASESTVKFHARNVMRKLGVGRRAEVAYVAGERGLLEHAER